MSRLEPDPRGPERGASRAAARARFEGLVDEAWREHHRAAAAADPVPARDVLALLAGGLEQRRGEGVRAALAARPADADRAFVAAARSGGGRASEGLAEALRGALLAGLIEACRDGAGPSARALAAVVARACHAAVRAQLAEGEGRAVVVEEALSLGAAGDFSEARALWCGPASSHPLSACLVRALDALEGSVDPRAPDPGPGAEIDGLSRRVAAVTEAPRLLEELYRFSSS